MHPRLRCLHWDGPDVPLPWGQLRYLSWRPANIDIFSRTLHQFSSITSLQLGFSWRFFEGVALPEPCVVPQVTTLFFSGNAAGLRAIITPLLRHLVLQKLTVEDDTEQDLAIMHLLGHSQCMLKTLEIYEGCSSSFPCLVLLHDSIAPSLARLVISSHDLNDFFSLLETVVPDSLPMNIRLLRAVDRCFHIDRLDFCAPGTSTSALALVLSCCFPCLVQLDLDDGFCWDDDDESDLFETSVVIGGERTFMVRRNAVLRREYDAWWNSWDGREFLHALQSGDLRALSEFEVPWDRISYGPLAGRNVFARPY
ncbi:hypothetical protein MSAN_02065700 [Mycena sanguinolenta]|uniref:Uncharacterized protein n=1 Tax=Mycena sanguinolenta TaxID=230812 RepID=A0A8H6XJW3_9AGAR|nr:hypothetical protein MSAN_02065700 [Mycena sanguinolenta]